MLNLLSLFSLVIARLRLRIMWIPQLPFSLPHWMAHGLLFLASVSSRSVTKIFTLSWTFVSKWGLLFDEGGVGVSMWALRLLRRSFSSSVSALSRRPGHYGLCASFVTILHCTMSQVILTPTCRVSGYPRQVIKVGAA
jgi:hypothetical protein